MSPPMDHDTCSQLLPAYLAGEAGADAPAIGAHLESCRQCRAESAGLQMLVAPAEAMTPAERERLRDGVARATRSEAPPLLQAVPSHTRTSDLPPRHTPRSARSRMERRRLAPALSAAAAILLIASGVALFQHLGTGIGGTASGSIEAPNGAPDRNANTGARGGAVPTFLAAPTFGPSVLPDVRQVERQALARLLADAPALSRTPVEQFAPGLLSRLAQSAPATLRSQILECGHRVIDQPGSTALPAYGSRVTVRGEPILALAFATPNSPTARLEIDGWALGSCDHRVLHRVVPASP